MNNRYKNFQNFDPPILGFGHSRQRTFYDREAFDFTLGKILGDGHINKKNQLEIDQKQKQYTEWNQNEMRRLGLCSQTATITQATRMRVDPQTSKTVRTTSHRCYSSALFGDFRKKFYVEKTPEDPTFGRGSSFRKAYPPELEQWFTSPYSLAIFYMDDGGLQENCAYFSTGEVSTREVLFVQHIFETNFGLKCTLSKVATTVSTKTSVYRGLRVRKESTQKFFDLVSPTIANVPCMLSKLYFPS